MRKSRWRELKRAGVRQSAMTEAMNWEQCWVTNESDPMGAPRRTRPSEETGTVEGRPAAKRVEEGETGE